MTNNLIETKTVQNNIYEFSLSKLDGGYHYVFDRKITPLAEKDVEVFTAQNDGKIVVDLTGNSLQARLLAGAKVTLSGLPKSDFREKLFSRFGRDGDQLRALVEKALPGEITLEPGNRYGFSLKENPVFMLGTTDGKTIFVSENELWDTDYEIANRNYRDNSKLIRHIVETAQTMDLGVEGDIWSDVWLEIQKKKIAEVYGETDQIDLEKTASKELLTLVAETTHEAAVTGEVETYSLLGKMFSGTTSGPLDCGLLLNLGFDTKEQEQIRYLLSAGIDLWRKYVETGEIEGVDKYTNEKMFERLERAPNKRDWLIGYFVSENLFPRSSHVGESIEHLFYSVMVMAGYTKEEENKSEEMPINEYSFAVEGELEGMQTDMAIALGHSINEQSPISIVRFDENKSVMMITNGHHHWKELEGAKVKPWFRSVNSPLNKKVWLNPTEDLKIEATSTVTSVGTVCRDMVVGQSLWVEPTDKVPGYFFIKNGNRQVTVTKVSNQISIVRDGVVTDSWKVKN